ncbi:MAG TPA: diguanylate cyclase [Candidatus Limnocylindrales bacterium]|nr:diguanylate cyclase [Candidatus Limnocylindrales bacterium]
MSALPDAVVAGPTGSTARFRRIRLRTTRLADPRLVAGLAVIAMGALVWIAATDPIGDPAWLVTRPLLLVGGYLAATGFARRSAHRRVQAERLRQQRMATVLSIAQRLTRTFDRDEILATIVTETNRTLDADGTTIRIVRHDVLVPEAWAGLTDETARRLPAFGLDEGFYGRAIRSRKVWVCDDVPAEPGSAAVVDRFAPDVRFAAEMIAPLFVEDRPIGALTAGSRERRHWTHDDLEFIAAVATHASIALQNAELFSSTEQRAGQLDVLRAASARLSRENTVESVGRAVVEETRRIIDYHNARVYLVEEPDDVVPIAFEGRVGEYDKVDFELLRTKLGVGFTGWVAANGQPLLIDDANADARGTAIPGTNDVDESMLCVPMRFDERVIGVITLSKLGLRQFSREDLRLLQILADQAATAVETARLLGRSQALAGELRRLLDMSSELGRSLDTRAVADLIARHLAAATGVDSCTISYWDRPGDRLLTWGCWPAGEIEMLQSAYDLRPFPETRRVLVDQVVSIVDAADPKADAAEVELLHEIGGRTLVMLPLVAKGESIGLVELTSTTSIAVDAQSLELARTMANEAAMALENARLYEDARALADRDQLTGFFNHRYLQERLGEEVVRAGRSKTPLSFLMIDLDDLKLVNDTFGHLFGDRVLAWTAERIRATMRASDVAARYGGDEFAVILPDTDREGADRAAERILDAFAGGPFESGDRGPVPIGVSIGIATLGTDGRTAQALIAAADGALYDVKRHGGNGVARGAVAEASPA